MKIYSLFAYAETVQDRLIVKGEVKNHLEILKIAANEILTGFSSLEEAETTENSFISPFGFEILPPAVFDAVNFKKTFDNL